MDRLSRRDLSRCVLGISAAKIYAILIVWLLFLRGELREGDLGFVFQRAGEARSTRVEEIRGSFVHRLTPFDGQWYQDIAERGYRKLAKIELAGRDLAPGNYAFFPLLPAVIWTIDSVLPRHAALVTLALSIACSIAGAAIVWRIARECTTGAAASVMLLLSFPAAVFQLVLYTEGIFLLLSSACLWFTHRGRLEAAAGLAFLAGLCRPQGVLLALPLFFRFVWPSLRGEDRDIPRALANAPFCAVPLSGFVAMAAIAWHLTGSPFAFLGIQSSWGREYAAGGFFAALASVPSYSGPAVDIVGFIFGVGLLPWVVRRLPLPLAAYGVGMVVMPLLTGTILSFGRFLSMSVPHFLVLAALVEKRRITRRVLIAAFIVLQVFVAAGLIAWHFVG